MGGHEEPGWRGPDHTRTGPPNRDLRLPRGPLDQTLAGRSLTRPHETIPSLLEQSWSPHQSCLPLLTHITVWRDRNIGNLVRRGTKPPGSVVHLALDWQS
jgi:hypothetical protein